MPVYRKAMNVLCNKLADSLIYDKFNSIVITAIMTKSLSLSLLLVLLYTTINAQTFPSYVGVKGGISISKLKGTNVQQFPINSNYSNRQGTDFELFIETKISKILTFQ